MVGSKKDSTQITAAKMRAEISVVGHLQSSYSEEQAIPYRTGSGKRRDAATQLNFAIRLLPLSVL